MTTSQHQRKREVGLAAGYLRALRAQARQARAGVVPDVAKLRRKATPVSVRRPPSLGK